MVITRQGKPAAIIMDVERDLDLKAALNEFHDPVYIRDLLEAQAEIRAGDGTDAEEVFRCSP